MIYGLFGLMVGTVLAVVFIEPILSFLGETERRIKNIIKAIKGE